MKNLGESGEQRSCDVKYFITLKTDFDNDPRGDPEISRTEYSFKQKRSSKIICR